MTPAIPPIRHPRAFNRPISENAKKINAALCRETKFRVRVKAKSRKIDMVKP